jgi:Adenomatosis polyposis coli down-regulated 1
MVHLLFGPFVAGRLVSGASLQTTSQPTAISIAGVWESDHCVIQERNGIRTSSRSLFVFLEREWALEFTQYSDAACTTPSLRAFFQGRYQIGEPSSAVPGARHADFGPCMTMTCSPKQIAVGADIAHGHVVEKGTCRRQDAYGSQLFPRARRNSI